MEQVSLESGYSRLSIALHWLTAIAVVALFMTHESARGSAAMAFHEGGGAIIGLFLLWRVWRRMRRGLAAEPDQAPALNMLSRVVLWGLLLAIVTVTLTGYLLPWSIGRPLDIHGLPIPSPLAANPGLHGIIEEAHDLAGHAFIPLVALHVLGVIKHWLLDTDGRIAGRMFAPTDGGR
jgi:cytochrome b561